MSTSDVQIDEYALRKTLEQYQSIEEAVIQVQDQRVVCYLKVTKKDMFHKGEFFRFLEEQGEWKKGIEMALVIMEEFPLSADGGLDHSSLPTVEDQWLEPESFTEEMIAEIWSQWVDADLIGINQHFYELGGLNEHVEAMMHHIAETFRVDLPRHFLITIPTIQELAQYIEQELINQKKDDKAVSVIQSVDRTQDLPLSSAQQRIWFFEQYSPGTSVYHIPFSLLLQGKLDMKKWHQSIHALVEQHESLRTVFLKVGEHPVQRILNEIEIPLHQYDLSNDEHSREKALQRIEKEIEIPFDLEQGPLIRCSLYRIGDEESIFSLQVHHLICDGWSMGVFMDELFRQYKARLQDRIPNPAVLPIQYGDYAVWQQANVNSQTIKNQLEYWKKQLEDVPVLQLPTDYVRPAKQTYRGATHTIELSESLSTSLQSLSQREGVSLFMTLLTAYLLLLYRYTGQTDLAVGSPVANRNRKEIEGLIGLFINTLVFRTNIDGNPTFIDILNRVREVALQAYANQDVPFEQIVETLRPDRSLSHSPLFQVMFVLQNMSLGFHPIDGLNTELIELQQPIAKFDLTLTMRERKEGLIATFEYNKDLFTKKTIQQIGDHFQKLLAEIVEAPHRVIDSFSLLTAEEEMQLWAWNQTTTTYPRNHSIGEEFVRQVKATPHQTALIMGAEKYTYQQVNQRANQLAHFFASKGVQNGSCVGILMNRSIEQIISLIALVKLGAVYVPLRVNDPILRLQQMISGLNCQYILTDEKWMNKADQLSIPTLILDHEKETIESESDENPEQVVEADDLLYIMFTSGSTGQPKGVEVLHRNVMRLVKGTDYIPFSDEQVFLQLAPLAFDASTFEIWGSLLHGATLVIMPTEVATPQEIGDVITQYGITTLWLTTGLFNTMVEENGNALTHLERVMVGGDIASPSHVEQLLAIGDMQIINFYGPTENTTFTTYYPIPANGLGKRSIPIGKPIANTQVYVLDQQMKQVPVGLPGELFVGGDGLARGYHQQAELTKDRFIEHPELGRLYRTGDLVRFLSSGDLEFIGRRDYQVKIRGFRIELPEIETVLTAHPQVRQVLVIVDNQMDEKRIVAYLVTEEAGLDWRSILKHHLPEYMIPAMFIELEEFPLTTNGKIDRHALPAPDWQQTSQEYEVPITPIEEWLSQVWSEYLKLSQVSTIANFFTLGGHSLLATRLISRINQAFGLQLPLRSIFEAPTIRELAGQIEQELAIQQPASLPSIQSVSRDVGHHPVSYAQQRLWFFERFLDQSTLYQIPFLLRVSGALDQDRLTACYWQLVARHESMRTLFYEQDGQAFQVIQDEQFGSWTVLDLSSQPDAYEQAFIDVKQDALTPFDLTKEPLIRGKLYKLGAEDWLLFIHMHHIISDGWSLHLLLDEWLTLYEGKSELPSLEIQYVDFASWQRDWLQQESFAQQLQYWTQQLADTPVLQLPTDFPRSAEQTFSGQVQTVRWQGEWINECKALAHHAGATPYMLLLAAFQLLLSRISGQADIALGSPIANRNHPEIEGLIGFFVNTLVIRTDLSKSSTFRQLLANVRQRTLEAYAHQDVPFEKVVDELQPERHLSHSPLFQVMFSMQTTTIDLADRAGLSFTDIPLPQETSKFDLSLNIAEENNEWIVSWEYNTNLFRAETIERFNQLFQHLLQQIVNEPDRLIHEYRLQLLDDQVQLQQWNQTTVPILESNLLAPLWDRVCQHPEAEAIVSGEERWSYQRLHERAEQWAKHLVQAGVQEGDRVAVWLHRSAEQIAALWGIWKAGATYLPLDRAYPQQRIEAICADAQVKGIICEKGEEHPSITQWTAEQLDAPTFEEVALPAFPNGEASAYLIYTSGSTGQPKGVEVSHRALCNLVQWHRRTYEVNKEDRMSWLAGVAFDASVWEIWPALVSGATLYLPTEEERLDPAMLQAFYLRSRITISFVPTPLLEQLLRMDWSDTGKLRVLLTGGDAMHHAPPPGFPIPVINHYGPTENTVVATAAEIPVGSQEVPAIGRPIANVTVHVLDEQQQAVPIGIPGELYLGGESLAKGYYGQPEQTAERWIEHPQWGRLYRTGDRVRYRWDGELEFLGRFDHQISLRGFRIELGEIEACLLRHPQIQEAVVEVWEERLVAYLVGDTVEGEAMRQWVKQRLPEYMVPRFYEWLPALPITPNGKVDRKALPEPAWEGEVTFVAARNEIEARLVHIWQEILQQPQIGIQDNFFACGGDSILSIQVVARAQREGLRLTPKQLFEHQTIAELAPYVQQQPQVAAEQGLVEGTVPFSPIQQWFWEQAIPNRNHWNQSLLLLWKETAIPDALQAALQAVIEQHDALRLRIVEEESVHQSIEAELPFTWVDLRGQPEEWQQQRIEQIADQAQQQLDLTKGPIQRMIYFQLGDQPDRLLWILHHWMVDAVSWRILLEDFQQAYQQATQQQPIQLPAKTSSWKDWIAQLQQYAQTQQVQKELPYWKQQVESITALPVDHPEGENRQAHLQMKVRTFTKEQTEALLRESTKAYRTQVTDLLLTAWAQTVQKWTASDICHLHLEGHGREEISEQLDLSRTVGWFTSLYPLKLDISEAETMGDAIKGVKEQIRAIPHKGLGYGLLQTWGKESSLTTAPKPEVSFNYLGQVDGTWSGDLLLGMAPEARGEMVDPTSERAHRIDLLGMVVAGRFQLTLQYSEQQYEQQTMDWLIQTYMEQLQQLITHCCSAEAGGYTPSDFPLAQVTQTELDQHVSHDQAIGNVENLYPLAPLQQGMLYHTLYQEEGSYVVQMTFRLRGRLDIESWRKAWSQTIEQFSVLRTSFHWKGWRMPHQQVHYQVDTGIQELDWRDWSAERQQQELEQYLQEDRRIGFNIAQSPLTRMTCIWMEDERVEVIWSYHHLILDGWSMPLVLRSLWEAYAALRNQERREVVAEVPYADYIAWIQKQDQQAAAHYWREQLSGNPEPTVIEGTRSRVKQEPSGIWYGELTTEQSRQLRKFAKQYQVTVQQVLQSVWALLLHHYSGEDDLLYGVTGAGRSAELTNVEKMVGLFINTLPTRVRVDGKTSYIDWCRSMQRQQLEQRQYEHCSLVDIQEWSGIPRDQALFKSLFVFENYPSSGLDQVDHAGLVIEEMQGVEQIDYPLCLVAAIADQVHMKWMYQGNVWTEYEVNQLHRSFCFLLEQIMEQPEKLLADIRLITEEEAVQFQQRQKNLLPVPPMLPYQFVEEIAWLESSQLAVVSQQQNMTYGQLNATANRLAHYLRKCGVTNETRVALLLDRSCELVIAHLAVHKAGGAFVPIDPAIPMQRVQEIIKDAEIQILLTHQRYLDEVNGIAEQVIALDGPPAEWEKEENENLDHVMQPDYLAYLIYTSGSTGKPKGVEITHRSLSNLIAWHQQEYEWGTSDHVTMIAGVSFDASVWEIWAALTSGATLHLPSEEVRIHPTELQSWLLEEGITYSFLPTPLMEQMFSLAWEHAGIMRAFLTGGDQLHQAPPADFPVPVVNHYGPTENTVVTTAIFLEPGEAHKEHRLPPIGRAIANVQLYVLNQYQQPVPDGIKGELYIGGHSLARGYHGQPDRTTEHFIIHPLYGRLYRTGDQVRRLEDGNLEFLGRLDQQVKIRGLRIELGEIEARLMQLPHVQECTVAPYENALIAYAVYSGEEIVDWKRELSSQLPAYMVPQQLIVLESMPVTPNGKVNRQALPKPEKLAIPYVAPRNLLEEQIAQIWSDVLNVDQVSVTASFFSLGGHSLLATQIVARVQQVFSCSFPLRQLMEQPTVEATATWIAEHQEQHRLPEIKPERSADDRYAPLSFAQQRLWLLDQLLSDRSVYNIPIALRLRGSVDFEALESSLKRVIERHESLRTRIVVVDQQPMQLITDYIPTIQRTDLQGEGSPEIQAAWLIAMETKRSFDLSKDSLLRIMLYQLDKEEAILAIQMHHMIADGWSMELFLKEWLNCYENARTGEEQSLPTLPIQYRDFAAWQKLPQVQQEMDRQLAYWVEQLSNLPTLQLPTDYPRAAEQTFHGATHQIILSDDLLQRLQQFTEQEGTTLFMIGMAAFQLLLGKWSGQTDFAVGSPIANRHIPEVESLIGFFVNTQVYRADLDGEYDFRQFMQYIRKLAIEAQAHQDVPFERVVEKVAPERHMSHSPLFQVMFTFQHSPQISTEWGQLCVEPFDVMQQTAKYDLTLTMGQNHRGKLVAIFEYNNDLFETTTIERMGGHFQHLLQMMCEEPERKLSSFSLLTLEEEQQLDEWNQTKQNDLITHPIPHLIIEKAIELPNAVAIHLQNQSFTYQQLLQAAKQLSDQLRRKLNIGKGQWVGLYMKRSYELIVAKLAVWLTGAAYIPLDPAYPTERIAFITEQSGMAALLVSEMEEELITQVRTQVFDYEQLIQEEQMDVALSAVEWDLDDPAYLIYTSGSTGLPKGVVITHRSLNNLVDWHIQQYQLTEQDRTSWLAGVAFDASVWEIWPTLVAGASLNIPNEMIRMVPEQLKNWYTEEKITLSFVPTPLLEQLYAVEWTKPVALRAILTGGDQLRMGPPRDFPVPVVNHYGPTENTVVTTSIELLPGKYEQTVPPIGYPISNVKVYVLDSDGKRVPIGVPGELWIGGNSLAEGYYCDSDLTAKRFIDHPQFGRLYQSGDQVRFLPTGHIEFLGRLDQQVKIRGFRIELGEIEHQLSKHEQVKEALVIADDQAGDKRLVAYVVPRSSGDWEEEWQTYLLQKLPDYMVPTQFIKLDAFPLTPNGKIDRRALPKPRASNSTSIVTTNDPIEEMIQKIWRDVLNQPIVGLEEDFFAIGGHSLLATQVISRVNQQYSIELPLRVLFEAKTIRKLAYHVKQEWKKIRDLAMPQLKQTVQIGERIPLSYAQQRLHFLNQLIQEPAAYNIPFAFYVHGEVDVEALQKSIQMLVERHASLRTAFVQEDGEWFQTIYEPSQSEISFEVMDYREHPSREAEVLVRLEKEAQFVFDLEHGPHFYCQLYLLSEEKSIFFINMHHIIADGWSIQIWLREWMECYEAAKKKVAYRKPGLPVQYIDYAAWQRSWLCGSVLEEQLQYWKEKLNHLPILQLPTDAPRPMKQTFAGNSYSIHLDHNLAKRLKEMSQKIDGTLFMTLLAAFEVLLYRWTGQQDFAIGTPVANRNVREVEECIGFFVNTLVLRSDLSESITFQKLLEQVKQTALEAYAHQEVPFERIVDEVQVERLLSHSPLIQVMFTLQNQPVEFPITEQFQLEAIPLQQKTAKFDLTLDMVEVEEGFIATFEYNTDLFEHQTIKWLGERWKLLLQQLIAEPKLPIEELGFVIEEEEKQLEIWNQTTVENQLDQPVHCLIEVQAEERPYSLALQHGASKLTYWQLNQRANQLAHYFKRIGLKANKPIMICLKRSIPYVIAQLAALKMGAIYLPVDPTQPLERIATLAKEANVQMIMAEPILSEPLSELGVRFFTWEMLEAETKHERVSNLSVSANLQSPAYLIFTSGSTGKPKGVAVSHESLLNLVYWHQRTYQVTANDRMSMLAGVAFDASVWEIWPTLASGASLHIPTEEERLNPVALQRFYLRERITHSFVPTPLLEQLLLLEWLEFGQLRYFLTGGDQLHQAPAQDFPITVINHYGPTENTVVATAGQVEAGSEQLPTIGRPIDNVTIYVLDQKMKQVPIGVPGELYLGGKSLAVGYYRQPDLTRERFIDHPDFGRLYRTGDQVRLRKNGEIEFLGRLDHQVKIRGFRIELGEVEVCLIGHPEVEEAVVIAHEGRLVAYIVGEIEPKELRRWAKERLPDYMVPTFYESMTFFPLTVNGKVDRKALPKPDESQWIHDGSYVAAKTEIEEALVTIWQDVLRQPKIGIHDNFFACGGDSILSIQVVARAGQLGLSLTPNQIFEHQTIAELAQVVEWRQPISAEQGLVEGDVPFSPIQQWFMEQEIPNRHHWNQSMMLLIGEQVDQKALEEAIRAIMGHHDVLRLRVAEDRSTHVQMDEPIPFDWVDLSGHPAAQHRSFIEQIAAEAQRSLHLQEGPIMRIVYFHLGDEEPDRLLWVIHHWVVDGVSWRILLEDLQTAYRQARQGEQIQLPAKTTSWKEWMNQLQNYAQSKQIQSEVAFWKGMQQHNPGKLPVDHPNGDNLQHTTRVVTQQLSIDETKELLETVGVKYRAHINELLISALAVAISRWTKSRQLMLHLEGHGREEMDGQVDVSRTVGWFTSIYPALIDLKQATTAGQVLREVKDSLRQIPNHGIGYGLYQYLQPVGQTMKPQQPIPLSFNYLGQFTMDQESSEGLLIGEALESQGMQMDPESERPHLLDLNAFVIGGQMTFTWLYSCQLFNQESIERVADEYMEGLRSLINDEEKSDLWSYTPSDFPEADLSKKDLQKVLSIIQKKRKR